MLIAYRKTKLTLIALDFLMEFFLDMNTYQFLANRKKELGGANLTWMELISRKKRRIK
jgi:hypothetical protein